MAQVILVTGGSRSGKSSYAVRMAEASPGPRAFIATCSVIDDEMRERVEKHRQARDASRWKTVLEETVDLAGALHSAGDHKVILVDCLTLWVNNLMHESLARGSDMTEDDVTRSCRALIEACERLSGTVIFVTNEVGMGIVPDNPLSRLFRDLAGRCNQVMAQGADVVTLVACGLHLNLKHTGET